MQQCASLPRYVEIVVAQNIGTETTTYVRNIYKFYVAYKLTLDAQELARQAREQMTPATPATPAKN